MDKEAGGSLTIEDLKAVFKDWKEGEPSRVDYYSAGCDETKAWLENFVTAAFKPGGAARRIDPPPFFLRPRVEIDETLPANAIVARNRKGEALQVMLLTEGKVICLDLAEARKHLGQMLISDRWWGRGWNST